VLALVVTGLLAHGSVYIRAADGAAPSIGEAEAAIRLAFNATLRAERVGANVSGLIVRLNDAGDLLVRAGIVYSSGNVTEADGMLGQCLGIAESVSSDANALRSSTLNKAGLVFREALAFSAVSVGLFVVVLMLVYRRFRRGYVTRVLGMKPEVESDES
jgi:hypothetical protein